MWSSHRGRPFISTGKLAGLIVVAVFVLGTAGQLPSAGGDSAAAATDPVVAAAGDIACDPTNTSYNGGLGTSNNCRQRYTSDLLVGANLSAVLPLGDNQNYCGSLAAYQQAYDPSWGRVKAISHPVPGNHEYLTSGGGSRGTLGCDPSNAGAAGYFDYWGAAAGQRGQGWYSFDVGSWHLIALNTNCSDAGGCGTSSPQYAWLAADLAAHPNRCVLAYFHIPLFSSGGRASSNSRSFWNLLYAAHADLVLDGHDHIYERFAPQSPTGQADPNGIREFIVGTGGENHTSIASVAANSVVRETSTYGVLELTLHSGSYDWQFVPEAGKTFTDSGSAACHNTSGSTDATAPSVPAGLAATPVSTSEIDLSWSASTDTGGSGLKGYKVYDGGTLVASTSSTSYADTGLATGSAHTFTVTAVDNAGNESAPSAPVTATTLTGGGGGGGGGGVVLVQQAAASAASSATLTVPLSRVSTAGDGLVAAVVLKAGSSASVSSVQDSSGSSWTRAATGYLTGTNSRIELWYRLAAPSLSSVTATLSSAKSASAQITEWTGLTGLDTAAGGSNASATTAATPTITTSSPNDLLIAGINYPSNVTSTPTPGPFTALPDFGYSTTVHGRTTYTLTTNSGTYQASWTLSGSSGGTGTTIAAFTTTPRSPLPPRRSW